MPNPIEILVSVKDAATAALGKISNSLSGIGESARAQTSGLASMSAGIKSVAANALSFGIAELGVKALTFAVQNGQEAFIGYNAAMEQSRISFTTLLKSADAAGVFLLKLQKVSDETPFDFPGIQQAAKMMLAYGFAARDVTPYLLTLSDAASGLSMQSDGIARIVTQLGQIKAKGKLDSTDVRPLTEMGIGVAEILKAKFGKTVEEINKSKISIDVIIKALMDGIDEQFGGLSEKQSKTFTGLMSTVKDQMASIFGALGEPLFAGVKNILQGVSQMTGRLSSIVREGGLARAFEEMIPPEWQARMEKIFQGVTGSFSALAPALASGGSLIADVFRMMADAVGTAFDIMTSSPIVKFMGGLLQVLNLVGDIVFTVGSNLAGLAGYGFKEVSKAIEDANKDLGDFGSGLVSYVKEKFSEFVKSIDFYLNEKMVGYFGTAFVACYEVSTTIFGKMKDALLAVVDELVTAILNKLLPLQGIFEGISGAINAAIANVNNIKIPESSGPSAGSFRKADGTYVIGGTDDSSVPVLPGLNVPTRTYSGPTAQPKKPQSIKEWFESFRASFNVNKGNGDLGNFNGSNTSGGGTSDKEAGKIKNVANKIQDAFNSLNEKIMGETESTYQLGFAKISDEMSKMQRELVDKAKSEGLDTSALESKMKEYARVMTEPITRAWKQAWTDMRNETALITAKMLDDKKGQAEAEFQIAVAGIEKQKREKMKGLGTGGVNDMVAQKAVNDWAILQTLNASKELEDKKRSAAVEEYDRTVAINQSLVDLHIKTQGEINQLNHQTLVDKMAMLDQELLKEGNTAAQILAIRQQQVATQQAMDAAPVTMGGAIVAGLRESQKSFGDFFSNMKQVAMQSAQAMQQAFSDFFFDDMTGKLKDLNDYLKSFLQGVARAISNALANAFAQKLIGGLFGGMFGARAAGGPVMAGTPYVVGERGPEIFMPSGNGTIIPNHAIGNNSAPVVNVYNNTGTKADVKTDVQFDGQKYVIGVVLDAYARNADGFRDIMGARA